MFSNLSEDRDGMASLPFLPICGITFRPILHRSGLSFDSTKVPIRNFLFRAPHHKTFGDQGFDNRKEEGAAVPASTIETQSGRTFERRDASPNPPVNQEQNKPTSGQMSDHKLASKHTHPAPFLISGIQLITRFVKLRV
jgi:hypothetical protein